DLTSRHRCVIFFLSCRRRHTRSKRDWSSDVCSSDLEARSLRAPGVRALRAAAAQARDWVNSPQETATRLLLLRAGYDEPRTNHRFWDEVKRKEYYLDLSYPEQKIAIEYDGKHHFTPEQARSDA